MGDQCILKDVFLHGNALQQLKTLKDESVHCCVTSPPYWGLRDYGIAAVNWPSVTFQPMPGLPEMTIPEMSCNYGLEEDLWAYIGHTVAIFREVKRVLRKDGTLWLNIGDSYSHSKKGGGNQNVDIRTKIYPQTQEFGELKPKDMVGIPWRVAFALQANGWFLRQDIIWHKPNPMPESVKDRCTKAHEYIFLLSKSKKYYYDHEAILEECSENTHLRVSQNLEKQKGSTRAHGGEKTMKAVYQDHKNLKREKPNTMHKNRVKGSGVGFGHGTDKEERKRGRVKAHTDFQEYTWGKVEKRNKRSVWTVPTQGIPEAHFATFPEGLIIPCVLAGCPLGGIILDPFGGAGTTALVSKSYGRNIIYIDIKKEYMDMAKDRLYREIPLLMEA